ncbi:MAG TPA: GMC oxidoreductase [Bryobacteraceae bacterium]|nr:GMC oxidoreductase [Bryobacteraceae bacterium]
MRFLRAVLFLALLTIALGHIADNCNAQDAAARGDGANDPLHAVHETLFSSFFPVSELDKDTKTTTLLLAARDEMWRSGGENPAFRELLAPFADLRGFGATCGIDNVVKRTGVTSFAALDRPAREHVLFLLQSCNANAPRRLATTIRNFYIVTGYSGIQEKLTGVKLSLFAPPGYVEQHSLHMPPTRLRVDREKHEIVSKDGPIDVLIVGSGPAGSVLAHELRRGGKRVLLVERGSFVVPGSMETRLVDDLIDTRTSMDGTIRIRNGMAVGGGSQVNVDLCFAPTTPAIRAKIEGWRKAGQIRPNEFTQAEIARQYEWVKQAMGTRTLSEAEINLNNHVLWDGARRAGLHPKLYSLNTYAPGKSPYPVTDKRSSESQLLIDALEDTSNPLSMVPDADVRRVLFEDHDGAQRAYGVEVRMRHPISEVGAIADPNHFGLNPGDTLTIRAKQVILSAGALGSPTVLLRSGVQNDQIGRGVILHPSMPVMGKFDHPIDVLKGTEASVYVDDMLVDRGYALESMADQPLYAALMSPGPAIHTFQMVQDFRKLAGFGVMLIDTPTPTNRLVLDAQGNPQIDYTLSEEDKKRFAEGIAEAVRIMFLAGAKEVYLPTTEDILGSFQNDASLQASVLTRPEEASLVQKNLHFISNRSVISSAHMQATDKMGSSPQDSVVGTDFHVWGTESLYVVDGSIFPTSIGANPMQSIYTFAKIFADSWNQAHQN